MDNILELKGAHKRKTVSVLLMAAILLFMGGCSLTTTDYKLTIFEPHGNRFAQGLDPTDNILLDLSLQEENMFNGVIIVPSFKKATHVPEFDLFLEAFAKTDTVRCSVKHIIVYTQQGECLYERDVDVEISLREVDGVYGDYYGRNGIIDIDDLIPIDEETLQEGGELKLILRLVACDADNIESEKEFEYVVKIEKFKIFTPGLM
ncbi:MAG: hypothetical protein LBN26_00765 [Christensenellaceae bacterium]|nr:hypothetical protein [Christensenellaceae bacterium]